MSIDVADDEKGARLARLPRHGAFYGAVALGVVALLLTLLVSPGHAVIIGVNAMFSAYPILVAIEMKRLTPTFLEKHADQADAPALAVFLTASAAVTVSVISLFVVLNGGGPPAVGEIVLSVLSVLLGWFAIHTMAGLHYAYEYYAAGGPLPGARKRAKGLVAGGLEFPSEDEPDGMDFIYFSYAIGMTAQVADVAVSSRRMRRIVLRHSVLAFFFNTIIIAATVNVVVALGRM